MTKNTKNESPLKLKTKDLVLDETFQAKEARKALGEKATAAQVKKETERRLAVAEELQQKVALPLGTTAQPFPMFGSQRTSYDGGSEVEQVLSVIADDQHPMFVYSERPYHEVVALALCDMPVPSMLPLFFEGLERRKPESTNRQQMMIGDPGAGKSFLGAHQSRLRSPQSANVFDCGGKNMNELLFEMVLDFGSGDALPKAIDKRLQAGVLEPLSVAKLAQLPSEAVSLDDSGHVASIDWNFFRGNAKPDQVDDAFRILTEVSKIEKLDNAGGNALGMNSQYGPLVQAFIEGKEIVLDEYNKSKEGSDNALQTVWQFVNGEISQCTVENPLKNKDTTNGPSSFTFRREDTQLGFFVTLTGNKTEDGLTTRSLNKSVYSRLSPETLPDPTEADWQHRICQMMVGMPVSTIYAAYKDAADEDPAAFGKWLLELRKTKAEMEGTPVPELQQALLENWKSVVHATEKLAKFYSNWSAMTNAENLMASGNTDLIEEVDEEYSKKEGIDFRKIKQHIEAALPIRPKMQSVDAVVKVDFKNFFKKPELAEKEYEDPSATFGTRLVDVLDQIVYDKSEAVGKSKLYDKLKTAMDKAGLRDVDLAEGAHSRQKSVEDDLNVSAFASSDIGKQALEARRVFCDFLRQSDPDIVEKDDDKIITLDRFSKALKAISSRDTAETHELFVVNRDHETLTNFPITGARIEDAALYPADMTEAPFQYGDLVKHDDFLAALAMPTVGAKNLAGIWDANIRPLTQDENAAPSNDNNAAGEKADVALDIAENRSSHGIATTTLRVAFEDASGVRDVSVHVVTNTQRGKTLIVSEALPSKLKAAFTMAGIVHVDRNDDGARAKVETALGDLTRGLPDGMKNYLRDAFGFRNDIDAEAKPDLADLLVDKNIEPVVGKYVLKTGARP